MSKDIPCEIILVSRSLKHGQEPSNNLKHKLDNLPCTLRLAKWTFGHWDLQDRSRTIRTITRMIRSSSWTTFKQVLTGFKQV